MGCLPACLQTGKSWETLFLEGAPFVVFNWFLLFRGPLYFYFMELIIVSLRYILPHELYRLVLSSQASSASADEIELFFEDSVKYPLHP